MFAVRNILLLLLVALLCSLSFGATFRTVKQGGGGDYTTIQAALTASGPNDVNGIIEVQDNSVYTENLSFPPDVNLTLRARDGNSPTIRLSGSAAETNYIDIRAPGTTIQGFKIDFSGSSYPTDNNSFLIHAGGGVSTVRDCNIFGPTSGYVRGIAGVARIEDVELSQCTIGVLCDINETASGFRYSISGCHIYDHRLRGVIFTDSNAVMDDCLVERCGESYAVPGGNILTGGNQGTLNLLITNSTIREALYGRNFNMEGTGTATIEDSIIMNALGGLATHSDEILQYRGTLNLNRCIIKAGQRCCVNMTAAGTTGSICNINHCDIRDSNAVNQWALTTTDPCAVLTVKNSILTGPTPSYGILRNSGTITNNWNDNFCDSSFGGNPPAVAGPNDIDTDPFYIQTDNPNAPGFFALQPYSPLVHADEDGNCMGSQGVLTGYEKWPADWRGPHGVDFNDFAVLASHWRQDNSIPPIPQLLLDDFNTPTDYTATGGSGQVGTLLGPRVAGKPDAWRVQLGWTYAGWNRNGCSSTLSLLTDANDANSPTKAMRWVYDVNGNPDVNEVKYTEILVVLANEVNFVPYNELRVSLKRHAGNSPDYETYMYARFLCNIYGQIPEPYPTGWDLTGPDKFDIANSVIGGQTATPADVYSDWTINFDNLAGWINFYTELRHVDAIIFGIRTQSEGPYGLGKGTIDVDDIRLVDRPGCTPLEGDLNNDCRVDFRDVKIFATLYWLEGK